MQQAFVNLRSSRPGQLPPPLPGYYENAGPAERAQPCSTVLLACTAIGAPAAVRKNVAFIQTYRR
jgi:hypothetical protein